ncbi:MAG TPA: UbiX family flavin prenyltransferase [Sediminibacterium sp.]|nr:UbiX family flavin prenyltransferase [Sediminibacterium sp.]
MPQKIAIAITGASGSIYAKLLLDKLVALSGQFKEAGIVMSNNAKEIWRQELGNEDYTKYPFRYFDKYDFTAPFASGSAQYDTLILIPCSMGTLGRIANGLSDDLVTRAADVVLKERRKLIAVVRETPFSLVHIRNMETITLAGGIICPANPSFYSNPQTPEAIAATVVDRVLDLSGFDHTAYRWGH